MFFKLFLSFPQVGVRKLGSSCTFVLRTNYVLSLTHHHAYVASHQHGGSRHMISELGLRWSFHLSTQNWWRFIIIGLELSIPIR